MSAHQWVRVPVGDSSGYSHLCAVCRYYDSGQEPFGCDLTPKALSRGVGGEETTDGR